MFIHMNNLYLISYPKLNCMKKISLTLLSATILTAAVFLSSCDGDESPAKPTISLSETLVTASPGEEVSVTIDATTAGGFKNLVVTKLWDGAVEDTETLTTLPSTPFVYTVTDEDADHITTLNFTITDKKNKTASTELVITVELTPMQLLLKYNWRLDQEVREKTGTNDISDVYTDLIRTIF